MAFQLERRCGDHSAVFVFDDKVVRQPARPVGGAAGLFQGIEKRVADERIVGTRQRIPYRCGNIGYVFDDAGNNGAISIGHVLYTSWVAAGPLE